MIKATSVYSGVAFIFLHVVFWILKPVADRLLTKSRKSLAPQGILVKATLKFNETEKPFSTNFLEHFTKKSQIARTNKAI